MTNRELARWQRWLVLAHVLLAVAYSFVVPPWEAHDETGHYAYINHLVTQRSLPDAVGGDKALLDQSHQPPLYYLVASALTFWVDRSDQLQPQVNLFAFDGTNRGGARLLLRDPGEPFPWRGTVLAVHMARLVSVALSGLMIWLIALTARRLFPDNPPAALLTTAFAALNPQVLFMASMVNNDIMVGLLGAALAYLIVSLSADDRQQTTDNRQRATIVRRLLLVGLVLGLSLVSKNSALILAPYTAAALLYLGWKQRWRLRQFVTAALLVGAPLAVIALPWYASNYARYGMLIVNRDPAEPITRAPTSVIGEGVFVSLRDGWLPQLFANTFRTYWGKFGWGNVQMPDFVYALLFLVCLAGLAGCVLGWRRANPLTRRGLSLLALMGVAMMLLPAYRAIFYQNPALMPGRYLMPALTAYSALLGFGWAAIAKTADGRQQTTDNRRRATDPSHWILYGLTAALGLLAIAVPVGILIPTYATPQVTKTDETTPVLLTFGDVGQLLGVSADTVYQQDREGLRQYARVRLKWRALQPTTTNLALGISVLGRDAEVLGTLNVHPGRGSYPTSNWQPGDTFEDEVLVLLEKPCAQLPAMGQVSVSMYEYAPAPAGSRSAISITRQIEARDGDGRPVSPIVGRFKIEAPAEKIPVYWQPPLGMLDGIALVQARVPHTATAGGPLAIDLVYETWNAGNREGIAFVHLLDGDGKLIAQSDRPPLNGAYPTDFWARGECVRDSFTLTLPVTATGALRAVTGLYSPHDLTRFKTGQPDDVISLGEVLVTP